MGVRIDAFLVLDHNCCFRYFTTSTKVVCYASIRKKTTSTGVRLVAPTSKGEHQRRLSFIPHAIDYRAHDVHDVRVLGQKVDHVL